MSIRIAVVQALDGHVTVCGPNDAGEGIDPLSQAISWHLECGHLPAASYWIEAELPPVPTIPQLRAKVIAGEFPKSLLEEMDRD